jgi:hypothetical protein
LPIWVLYLRYQKPQVCNFGFAVASQWTSYSSYAWNIKVNQGFNHQVTGTLLCPAGVDLVRQGVSQSIWIVSFSQHPLHQAFKHIFTSPSLVEREEKVTISMAWCVLHLLQLHMQLPRSVISSFKLDSLSISGYPLGYVFSHFLTSFHLHSQCDRLWMILQQYFWPPRGPWGGKRCGWPSYLMESVRFIITNSLHSYSPSRQVFPNYTAVSHPVSKDSAF